MRVDISRLVATIVVTAAASMSAVTSFAQDFGYPELLSNALPDTDTGSDYLPQVTTDGAGKWIAVWSSNDTLQGSIGTDYDILVSRSTDSGVTWTAPAALNTNAATDSGADLNPQIATDGTGTWVAVWHSTDSLGGTIGSDTDILVSRSVDNGLSWTPPAALNTNAAIDAALDEWPALSTDAAGNWVTVWHSNDSLGGTIGIDLDLLLSRSNDGGVTWTPAAALSPNAATDTGGDHTPQITNDGAGNWVAVWVSTDDLSGTIGNDHDILVARSANNGATWTAPAALNTYADVDSATDIFPSITTDGLGNWMATWTSDETFGGTYGPDDEILVSRSSNNGATWSGPSALNTEAAIEMRPEYGSRVATDGAGAWVAVWVSEDSLGGTIGTDPDIVVARSTNNGLTWTDPAALNSNASSDGDAVDLVPQIVTDGAGVWLTVWLSEDSLGGTIGTDQDILFARSTNNGGMWTAQDALNTNAGADPGSDSTPRVTSDGAGNWVAVWSSADDLGGTIGADLDILYSRSTDDAASWTAPAALNTNAPSDSGFDYEPRLAADGAGNWVAAWSSNDSLGGTIGSDYDILVSRTTDNGATWTAPAALNTNAVTDSGDDSSVELTTDGAGNWVAVWYSNDSLGGTIGSDNDILVARSSDNGASWSAPAALNTNAAADSGSDVLPRVTTDGNGQWVTLWASTDTLGGTIGTDNDILVSRSSNNGATWTAPAPVNSNAGSDVRTDTAVDVASDGAGNWLATWLSNDTLGGTVGLDFDILYSRSTDNGATWTPLAVLNSNAAVDSANDAQPDLAVDPLGNWAVVWSVSLGGLLGSDSDIVIARSADVGATWSAPEALNGNAGTDAGADTNPAVANDGEGHWVAVWGSLDDLDDTAGFGVGDIFVATGDLCGDSFVVGLEECDDGNIAAGDCCSAVCEAEIVDTASCFVAPSTKLTIGDSTDDTKDKLSWQWGKGEEVLVGDLGTPDATTDYTLCVFDTSGSATSIAAVLEIPASMRWTDKDAKGYQYKDKDATADGVTGLSLSPGAATKSKVKLKAKGAAIDLPGAVGMQYFAQTPKVIVQLTNSVGECWTSEFLSADTSKNTTTSFKAKTK